MDTYRQNRGASGKVTIRESRFIDAETLRGSSDLS